MLMCPYRKVMISLHIIGLLILTQLTQSFVLLTANIDDIKKFARKVFSDSLADKIVDFIAQASEKTIPNVSKENEENAGNVQDVSENELEQFHKAARQQMHSSKRFKQLTQKITSTMYRSEPAEYRNPDSLENLRHKPSYQVKVGKSKVRNRPKDTLNSLISSHREKPAVEVHHNLNSKYLYHKRPQTPEKFKSHIFHWEKKPVEPANVYDSDDKMAKQPVWIEQESIYKLKEMEKQIQTSNEKKDDQQSQQTYYNEPRQPYKAKNKHVMPITENYPNKIKQHVLISLKPPGRNVPLFKIQRDDISEKTTHKPKFTSGYAETRDTSIWRFRGQRVKPRSDVQRFALPNAEEESPNPIPPIVAKSTNDTNTDFNEEMKPMMEIQFAGEITPNIRAGKEEVSEVTTEKEKVDFDQYDLVNNHTPTVVATSENMEVRRVQKEWWEKPMTKIVK